LADRALSGIGLNGRAVIPLILGFGCVTLATIVTRVLGSERERRIAVFLLGLAIPCSAQLAVIAGLLTTLGGIYVITYVTVIFTILVVVGTLLNRFLPGESTDLLIDLPPLRIPRVDNVLKKTITKSYRFLLEATPLFAGGALLIGILQVTGLIQLLQTGLKPLTVGWLGLPKETAAIFIMGFIRRDFGAAGLANLPLTSMETVIGLITITLFVPCIASTLIIFKERGRKEAFIMWPAIMITAFLIGGLTSKIHDLTGSALGVIGVTAAVLAAAAVMTGIPRPGNGKWCPGAGKGMEG
jgi:ferrous iron transport protein B